MLGSWRIFVGLGALAIAACSSANSSTDETSNANEPAGSCAIGTRPSADDGSCTPVGPAAPASAGDFVPEATGWGFAAVRPAHRCERGTIAVLGERDCQPIDDCGAAFPPAGATLVTPATIKDALAKGGLIALDEGDYDAISIAKDVTLVGRCATKVRIRSPKPVADVPPGEDSGAREKGIDIPVGANVELSSITIEGFEFGVYTDRPPSHVKLDRMVLAGNRTALVANFGVTVDVTRTVFEDSLDFPRSDLGGPNVYYGSKVTLTGIDVRGMDAGITAMSPETEVTVRRSFVSDPHTPVYRGCELQAFRGAKVTVEDSFLTANAGFVMETGRFLADPPARDKNAGAGTVEVKRSVLVYDGLRGGDPSFHEGIMNLWDGAHVDLEDTTVVHQSGEAIAIMTGSLFSTHRTAILAAPGVASERAAIGIHDGSSKAEIEDTVIAGASQIAVFLRDRNASLAMNRSLITGTKHTATIDFSDIGGTGQAIAAAPETHVALTDSALVGNEGIGIFALDGAVVSLTHSLVDDTRVTPDGALGTGVYVIGAQLGVDGSTVRRSADAAVAFDGAMGIVTSTWFSDNPIAIRTAGGTSEIDAAGPPSDFQPNQVQIFGAHFMRNGASFREGAPALP